MDQFLPKFLKEASFRRLAADTTVAVWWPVPATLSTHNYTGYGDETEQVSSLRSQVDFIDAKDKITLAYQLNTQGDRRTVNLSFYDVQAMIDSGVFTIEPDTRDYPLIKLTFGPNSRQMIQKFLNSIGRVQPKIIRSKVVVNGIALDCTIELDPSEDNTVTGSITAGDSLYMALSATELMQLASGNTITRNGRKVSLPPKLAGDLGVQIDMLVEQMHNRQATLMQSERNVNINNIPFEKASAKIFTVPVSGILNVNEDLPPYPLAHTEHGFKTTITLTPVAPYVYNATADIHAPGAGVRATCQGMYDMTLGHTNSVPTKIRNIVKRVDLRGRFQIGTTMDFYPTRYYNVFYTCNIPDNIVGDMLIAMDEAMELGEI